jgi:hypothetical protein
MWKKIIVKSKNKLWILNYKYKKKLMNAKKKLNMWKKKIINVKNKLNMRLKK